MKRKDLPPPLESVKVESPPPKKTKDCPVILTTLVSASEARKKSTEIRGETDYLRAAVDELWPFIESQITQAIADGEPSRDINIFKLQKLRLIDRATDICADKIKDLGYDCSVSTSYGMTLFCVSWG